ncbi:MAG: TRAP transporter small permease [Lachnospiraceae bacterium]|jgi:TRAP-type C4-dicarboxylate transport system permease small subunit
MNKIWNIINKVGNFICYIGMIVIAASMLWTVVDVLMRVLLKKPIVGSNEFIELGLLAIVMTGIVYTQIQRGHIKILVLIRKFYRIPKLLMVAFGDLICAAMSAILAWSLFKYGRKTFMAGDSSMIIELPYYIFAYAYFVCMVVFTLVLIYEAIYAIYATKNDEAYKSLESTWV